LSDRFVLYILADGLISVLRLIGFVKDFAEILPAEYLLV
jgi:hypothetical protein